MCVAEFRIGCFGGLLCFVDVLLCRTVASSLASSLKIAYLLLVNIGVGFNVCWQDKARVLLSILFASILVAPNRHFPIDVAVSTVSSGP